MNRASLPHSSAQLSLRSPLPPIMIIWSRHHSAALPSSIGYIFSRGGPLPASRGSKPSNSSASSATSSISMPKPWVPPTQSFPRQVSEQTAKANTIVSLAVRTAAVLYFHMKNSPALRTARPKCIRRRQHLVHKPKVSVEVSAGRHTHLMYKIFLSGRQLWRVGILRNGVTSMPSPIAVCSWMRKFGMAASRWSDAASAMGPNGQCGATAVTPKHPPTRARAQAVTRTQNHVYTVSSHAYCLRTNSLRFSHCSDFARFPDATSLN